ncbi:prephenate dehydratase protein [Rutstroemia sp. NJR-2017a BBW]|nr:prephenate dehydratase protein [Rutstroemia sp. NJR-2017a BBW]
MQSNPSSSTSRSAISFLGPISSYTHQVFDLRLIKCPSPFFCQHYEPHAIPIGLTDDYHAQAALGCFDQEKYEYQPAIGIPDVFDAVQSGKAALGVVPFENSTNGAVIFTLELLADRHSLYKDLTICGEAYLDVSHCLLGHFSKADSPERSGTCTPTTATPSPVKPKTKPLSSLRHIQRLYTHPQAYGQCEAFLGTYLKGIERLDVSSTSKAAEIVKADKSGTSAAIASQLAADIHGLDILAQGIEDRDDNTTRFFILRKGIDTSATKANSPSKSMVSFTIDHRTPGALAAVLDCFKSYKLNLTSINSRPTKVVPFQYIFFVEFEGSKLSDPEGKVAGALGNLDKYTQSWRWLGSWEDKLHVESSLKSELFDELTTRPPNIIYDDLSPTHSNLLDISLADFVPAAYSPTDDPSSLMIERPCARASNDKSRLPQSHHIVYFNPEVPSNELFPDGTDALHSPGPPFMRRMWAGGSIAFNKFENRQLHLNTRAVCIERIVDVTVKGGQGDEKIFVNIERRIGPVGNENSTLRDDSAIDQQLLSRYRADDADYIGQAALVESRIIVFMREKDIPTAKKDQMKPSKVIKRKLSCSNNRPFTNYYLLPKAIHKPDFFVRFVPTPSLLFRFSALTFNAHAIHLDPQYCREIEGHRNLLVHGPLSLVVMLTVLTSQLPKGVIIKQFDYRNLAPLYVNEELRVCMVCVGRKTDNEHKYEVWIEGEEGGYAVKGSAVVGPAEYLKRWPRR